MNPTNAGVSPSSRAALLHRLDKHFADQGDQQGDAGQGDQRQPQRPRGFVAFAMGRAAENLAVRLERKYQAQTVRHHEQHGQAHAQMLHERGCRRRVGFTDSRGHQQGDGRQKQQAGLQPGVHPVELLHVMRESAEEKDAPSMNSVLVTMAPAMEAFTSMYCPARTAVNAMTSSVRFPSVALSRPPTASPVLAATDSVA